MDFLAKRDDAITELEIRHTVTVRELASECLVLLENDGTLPIVNPCRVALYGNGARHTVKGGGGSGEVNTRYNVSICDGLAEAGFEIASSGWLDRYDESYYSALDAYMSKVENIAAERGVPQTSIYFEIAFEAPTMPLITDEDLAEAACDTAIFVISRDSTEGRDRTPTKGDYYLTDEESSNIDFLIAHFKKVIVLLNVGGVIDMSELKSRAGINSILFVGQVGNLTGDIVADVITGKVNPSGKLVDTWAASYEDYPCADEYPVVSGKTDDVYYREGIYVGYRYFDSFGIQPLYPFGYGKSYTTFTMETFDCIQDGTDVKIAVRVTNTGTEYAGKEVVQVYFSAPEGEIDRPYQELAAFAKSGLIAPGESETVIVAIPIESFTCFDSEYTAKVIPEGDYLIRVGSHSRDTKIGMVVNVPETVIKEKYSRILEDDFEHRFEDMKNPGIGKRDREAVDAAQLAECTLGLTLNLSRVRRGIIRYRGLNETHVDSRRDETLTLGNVIGRNAGVAEFVAQLTLHELADLLVGDYMKEGYEDVIFSSSIRVPGAAAETSWRLERTRRFPVLIMADGPAGLRLQPHFKTTAQGDLLRGGETFGLIENPFPDDTPEDAVDYYQYCTMIPVATSLASSWNLGIIESMGRLVGEEMEEFGVNLWLAPGMNIHRNPLCGRNFEYFSEDPLITGLFAAADIKGVQSVDGKGVTIKHFACNNHEDNRMFSNSHVSVRALREIYLKGFEIAVKVAQPFCVMASYNLLNGIHTANNFELIQNVLRDEWDFEGAVMTDWFSSFEDVEFLGYNEADLKYPPAFSRLCVYAGCDMQMPGCAKNAEDIVTAVNNGKLSLSDVQAAAMNIVRLAIRCI
ncbi:MAG: glycoside hydrolase family 3 C-terminal domain-containing protein [Saccharofermentans sp.]|nr:glycoside hydrolase family 3 C-terminal domain-containing protein [Saccharofermentans sp.]